MAKAPPYQIRPGTSPSRSSLFRLLGLQGLVLLAAMGGTPAVRAGEITATTGAQGLGTLVNGGTSCTSGLCAVTGGTAAGSNLFHRFNAFNTSGGQISGASIDNSTSGATNVFVGVLSPTLIDRNVGLTSPGSLTWLSPAGISIQGAGGFTNVTNLTLSTASSARIGNGVFDALSTTATQAAALNGAPVAGRAGLLSDPQTLTKNGDLTLSGGLLTVDKELLLDAQGGNVLLQNAQLSASNSISLNADQISLYQSQLHATEINGAGGMIKLEGRGINIAASTFDTSAAFKGGLIAIGGGEFGKDPRIMNAGNVSIDGMSSFKSDALIQGNGGVIIVYAKDNASISGQFSARGGQAGGDGGKVETSSSQLDIRGIKRVDTTAAKGQTGTWLLDPTDFTISSLGPTGANGITAADLQLRLALSNVIIATDNSTGSQVGDINVNAPVSWSANRLTLSAYRNINVNANLTATGTGSLTFQYGQGSLYGAGATYTVASTANVEVPLTPTAFTWEKGSAGIEYPVVLDNGLLRFWDGASSSTPSSRFSFNGAGVLQQPAYLDSSSTWRQLTFSNRPLEFAIGIGGDGSNNWNLNGTILSSGAYTDTTPSSFTSLGISNARMNVSRYLEGTGTVTTSINISPSSVPGSSLRIINDYSLAPGASSVRVDSTLVNLSSQPISNLRYWYGTGDDYVNGSDNTTKTRGNLSANGFQPIASSSDPSNAILITANGQGVTFYSPSPGTTTIIYPHWGDFSNVFTQDPSTAYTTYQSDGAYGIYLRYPDLNPGASANSTYLYTTGSTAIASTAAWNWASAVSLPGTTNEYNWFDTTNWLSGILPNNDFSVTIADDPTGLRRIIFDPVALYNQPSTYNLRLFNLTSYESIDINSGTLSLGTQVFQSSQLLGSSSLNLNGGTLSVNGTLTVPNLLLNAGSLNGSGRIYVNNSFLQAALGSDLTRSNVAMGQLFDIFSLATNSTTTIRQLFANGDVSITTNAGDLGVEGAITSSNGNVNLQANGTSGQLSLQPGAQLTASGRQISLQASQGLTMASGAIVDASTTTGNGGTVLMDAPVIALSGLTSTASINTSGANTGGSISLGSRIQPNTVTLTNLYSNADPPLVGGSISIFGTNINITNSTFNVTGSSGGNVAIGNSSTSQLNIQGASLIAGGGATFGFTGASIFTSGLSITGGTLVSTIVVPLTSFDPSSSLVSTYLAATATLTQTPLLAQQSETSGSTTVGVSFISAPLTPAAAPQPAPTVALTLQQSGFLYAEDYSLQTSTTQPPLTPQTQTQNQLTTQSTTTTTTSEEDKKKELNASPIIKTSNTTAATTTQERTAGDAKPSPNNPSSLTQELTSSPVSRSSTSAELTGKGTTGSSGSGTSSSGTASGGVTTVSSEKASASFTESEARAQSDTAAKLGLSDKGVTPPTPAQIQGVLQRVIQSLRGPSSSSK